jgi:hypothetical protein
MRRLAVLQERGIGLIVHATRAMQLRDDDAGIDGVDANALRRQLERRAARQLIDARLAHAISQHAGKGPQAGDARHVDDIAPRGFQMRHG